MKGNREVKQYDNEVALGFGSREVISDLGDRVETRLQGVQTKVGGEEIKKVGLSSMLQEFGGVRWKEN